MKTVLFNSPVARGYAEPLSIQVIPDSAVITDNRPFFLPDFDDKWVYTPAIAFRISRLGKSIGKQFAIRYFDAIALAIRPVPVNLTERLLTCNADSALSCAFDGALLTGAWLPAPAPDTAITGTIGDYSFSYTTDDLNINEAIHRISDYMTLKMGDIIIPSLLPNAQPLNINDKLTGTVNGTECLHFRVK